MSSTREILGYRISSMRGFRHMTQDELGGFCGVKKQTVSGWEGGKASPDAGKLVLLSKALDCSVDYLLGLVDSPNEHYKGGGLK